MRHRLLQAGARQCAAIGPPRNISLRIACTSIVSLLAAGALVSTPTRAQPQTPVFGHYPGGHTGLRNAATPKPGWAYANFSRFHWSSELVNGNGDDVGNTDQSFYANISVIDLVTEHEIFGMNYGAFTAIPFNDIYNRPSGGTDDVSGFGIGDIALVPLVLYGKKGSFDYQAGLGFWAPTGKFKPGDTDSHGAGFWSLIGSAGVCYYPSEDRRAWSMSGLVRYEWNFDQKYTDINVGHDLVLDYGIGRMFEVGKSSQNLLDVGLSGFGKWQTTRETGVNAAPDSTKYKVFGAGPEVQLIVPSRKMKLIFRAHHEFGAINTSEGNTFWSSFQFEI